MKRNINEDFDDFEDENTREFIGHGVAYIDTGCGLTGALVDYQIKYKPVGQERDQCPKEQWSRPLDESDFVFLIPPLASKKDVYDFLLEIRELLKKDGLFLGTWLNQDYHNPYHLFDRGSRIVGTLESQLVTPESETYE